MSILGNLEKYLSYDEVMQERGYKPILIFTTVNDYDDWEGRRTIVSTVPHDVQLQTDTSYLPFKDQLGVTWSSLKDRLQSIGSEISSSLTGVSGEVTDADRALQGFMVDLSVAQQSPQPYSWANIIFQNPLAVSPSGDQFFGSDFLKYGYPVWFQIGYVDNLGQVVPHPFTQTISNDVPIVFAGLIGALDQELTMQAGDRLLLQAADYRWYFDNFQYGQGTVDDDWQLDDTDELIDVLKKFFEKFLEDGAKTAPKAIMSAMGFRILKTKIKEPKITKDNFDSHVSPKKLPQLPKDDRTIAEPMKTTYLSILRRIENVYKVDINWRAINLYETKITVMPRLDPYSMAFKKSGKKTFKLDPAFDTKVHQAVLGGNVRNWKFGIDAAGAVNRVIFKIVDPDSGEAAESFLMEKVVIDDILREWKETLGGTPANLTPNVPKSHDDVSEAKLTESTYNTRTGTNILGAILPTASDLDRVFGKQTRAIELVISKDELKDRAKGIRLKIRGKTIPYPKQAIEEILRRLHYWGADGSIMMMGNADIREGDLIEVFDRRPKGTTLLGFQPDTTQQTMSSFLERYKEQIQREDPKLDVTKYKKNKYLGLRMFENIFYVWKVRHYVGPQGFWTKVYFRKQRDAVLTDKSKIFKTLRERSKRRED